MQTKLLVFLRKQIILAPPIKYPLGLRLTRLKIWFTVCARAHPTNSVRPCKVSRQTDQKEKFGIHSSILELQAGFAPFLSTRLLTYLLHIQVPTYRRKLELD
jgi:hypothetical protein